MQNGEKNDEARLRDHGLAFFGSITASSTHELNNVMSIIEQNAGLVEDLCAGTEFGRPLSVEKLREISEKIQNQIQRGVLITKRLNYFAHSVDEPLAIVPVSTLVKNLVDICQRFATLKKLTLEGTYPDDEISIQSNPFVLEQAIYSCIEQTMAVLEKDSLLSVIVRKDDTSISIGIYGSTAGEIGSHPTISEIVELLVGQINGTIEPDTDDGRAGYKIVLSR